MLQEIRQRINETNKLYISQFKWLMSAIGIALSAIGLATGITIAAIHS